MRQRLAVTLITATVVILALAVGCSDDAAPGECIDAAREAGIPDAVVEWMKQPSDELGSIERIAIREALEQAGLGDACSEVSDRLGIAAGAVDQVGSTVAQEANVPSPVAETASPTRTESSNAEREQRAATPSTPQPPDTPIPSSAPLPRLTSTPEPARTPTRRTLVQQSDYLIPERYDDYPEVVALRHLGLPGSSTSRFLVIFDEPVYADQHDEVTLTAYHPEYGEYILELRTRTSRSRPSLSLEFGPVERNLSRVYYLNGYSYLRDKDGHSVEFDSDALINHPNSLFVSTNYAPEIENRNLARCAGIMEFNKVSPIVVKSLIDLDVVGLTDTERFDWLITLNSELGNADVYSDRVHLDYNGSDFLLLMRHPCAALWSEEITAENADKRNDIGNCHTDDPDVAVLLDASYLDLSVTDRLVLRRELGGWDAEACMMHYPQLYLGAWMPLELP